MGIYLVIVIGGLVALAAIIFTGLGIFFGLKYR